MTKHLKATIFSTLLFAVLMTAFHLWQHKSVREAVIQSVFTALIFGVVLFFFNRKKEKKEPTGSSE